MEIDAEMYVRAFNSIYLQITLLSIEQVRCMRIFRARATVENSRNAKNTFAAHKKRLPMPLMHLTAREPWL